MAGFFVCYGTVYINRTEINFFVFCVSFLVEKLVFLCMISILVIFGETYLPKGQWSLSFEQSFFLLKKYFIHNLELFS